MKKLDQLIRIQSVEVLTDFWVRVTFTDHSQRVIDLRPYLHGPIFDPIRLDPILFRMVSVDSRMKTLVWPNGADIDPDVLYHNLPPAWMEQEELIAAI